MFGFMRTRSCQRHYCGVCKTIGSEYGHAPRMLLNHDTVLIAEIMTALSPEPVRHPVLSRRSCLQIPKAGSTPLALRYAAAATILLAGAKIRDHAADTGKAGWRLLSGALNSRYRAAKTSLEGWGLGVERIESELATQTTREASPASLAQLAAPTAFATSAVCGSAAVAAGRPDAEPALAGFGDAFGRLIYLLDAWHDYAKDAVSGQFNAIQAIHGSREQGRAAIDAAAREVEQSIQALPLAGRAREALRTRFQANLTMSMAAKKEAGSKLSDCLPNCMPDACDSCCDCDCCCDCGSCCDGCDCG
jgi:hypothetical protein